MSTPIEFARIAAAINILRPEWPTRSIQTLLERDHHHRPYHDLAVAATWIATDPDTHTPARLAEAGPWWLALSTAVTPGPPRYDPAEAEARRANAAPPPADFADQVRAGIQANPRQPNTKPAGIGAHDRTRRPVEIPDAVRRELDAARPVDPLNLSNSAPGEQQVAGSLRVKETKTK